MDIKQKIRTVPHWPIKGVMFRDITSLMQDAEAFRQSCDRLFDRYKDMKIDKVVGIDARGFIFGSVLAYRLGAGFVPIRKKGKLPSKTIEAEYKLEYGIATVEIHSDSIDAGEKILIVDDLMATGGTMAAAINLVEKLGGNIVECAFIVELPDLKGREKLGGKQVFTLTEFSGQ